jgi:hypothetical protein
MKTIIEILVILLLIRINLALWWQGGISVDVKETINKGEKEQ